MPRSGSSLNSGWQKKSIFPPIPQLVGNLHCVTQETAKTEKTLDPLHLPLTTLQSFNWIFMKFPNLKYPLFGLFSSSNWRPCIAGCFDYPWTVARSNGKSNSNVESNLEIKLGFPHTTPLPDWLLSECNNFTQFFIGCLCLHIFKPPMFWVLGRSVSYWLHPRPLAAWNKMFYSLEIAMFRKHYDGPPKQFKGFGGVNHFISRN